MNLFPVKEHLQKLVFGASVFCYECDISVGDVQAR
jgi:hypothetical protein